MAATVVVRRRRKEEDEDGMTGSRPTRRKKDGFPSSDSINNVRLWTPEMTWTIGRDHGGVQRRRQGAQNNPRPLSRHAVFVKPTRKSRKKKSKKKSKKNWFSFSVPQSTRFRLAPLSLRPQTNVGKGVSLQQKQELQRQVFGFSLPNQRRSSRAIDRVG